MPSEKLSCRSIPSLVTNIGLWIMNAVQVQGFLAGMAARCRNPGLFRMCPFAGTGLKTAWCMCRRSGLGAGVLNQSPLQPFPVTREGKNSKEGLSDCNICKCLRLIVSKKSSAGARARPSEIRSGLECLAISSLESSRLSRHMQAAAAAQSRVTSGW